MKWKGIFIESNGGDIVLGKVAIVAVVAVGVIGAGLFIKNKNK